VGQQQLLLLVLAVIIIGLAILAGLTLMNDQAARANLDALCNDLVNLGAQAQEYAVRPAILGGGGGSFAGLTLDYLISSPANENGSFALTVDGATRAIITGTGLRDGDGNGLACQAQIYVEMGGVNLMVMEF